MVVLYSSLRASARTLPTSLSSRLIHITSAAAIETPSGRDPRLSQGSVSKTKHEHPGDPHDQSARSGQRTRGQTQSSSPYDAANPTSDKKTDRSGLSGNTEGVGFAEQVGSASATSFGQTGEARPGAGEGKGGREESTPPGLFATLKSKLGLSTSADEVKQNRGGGVGVTGTGALPFEKKPQEGRRPYHTSAALFTEPTVGQAPEASRQPKERTNGEQNAHLQHKYGDAPDNGKGNAAADPKLPSHQVSKDKPAGIAQQRRAFSTSSPRLADDQEVSHTADSYFKDVDESPPSSDRTHQVDSTSVGEKVMRPNEPLTGQYSRAGPQTKEYQTVDNDSGYDVPPSEGAEKDQKLRYGNVPTYSDSHSTGSHASKADEGPEGSSAGGRKPEGR
ncbi:hypothetical protein BD309DRAFT_890956 [Dichomitus squalens]|nr:hypothetical protein BD309DRAFT_890956 [Dichomitus squalens]